jgi:hypothetical protein
MVQRLQVTELRHHRSCHDVWAQSKHYVPVSWRRGGEVRTILRKTLGIGQNVATERGDFVTKVLRRLFRAVGKTYSARATATPEWYLSNSWSVEQRDAFQDWLTTTLVRTRRLRTGDARFQASMFLLWYGWKVQEPDHTDQSERRRTSSVWRKPTETGIKEHFVTSGILQMEPGGTMQGTSKPGSRPRVWINNDLCVRT